MEVATHQSTRQLETHYQLKDREFQYQEANESHVLDIQRHVRAAIRLICAVRMGLSLECGLHQCIQDMRVSIRYGPSVGALVLTDNLASLVPYTAGLVHASCNACETVQRQAADRYLGENASTAMNEYIDWHLNEARRLCDLIVLDDGHVRLSPRPRAASSPS